MLYNRRGTERTGTPYSRSLESEVHLRDVKRTSDVRTASARVSLHSCDIWVYAVARNAKTPHMTDPGQVHGLRALTVRPQFGYRRGERAKGQTGQPPSLHCYKSETSPRLRPTCIQAHVYAGNGYSALKLPPHTLPTLLFLSPTSPRASALPVVTAYIPTAEADGRRPTADHNWGFPSSTGEHTSAASSCFTSLARLHGYRCCGRVSGIRDRQCWCLGRVYQP